MAFTKKTWVSGEDITAAEMQNIEDGLDDIYNQNLTFATGKKTFEGDIYVANAESAGDGFYIEELGTPTLNGYLYSGAGIAMGIAQEGSFPTRFETSGSLANIVAGLVNNMYVENHAARHQGALDSVITAATIIVDQNGKGDYPTLRDAINVAGLTDLIYVREGTYTGVDISSSGKRLTIIGSGPSTIIQQNMTFNSQYLYIANMSIEGSLTINGNNAWIDRVILEGVFTLNGGNNCFYNGKIVGGVVIALGKNRNVFVGNELQTTSLLDILSDRNVVFGNVFLYSETVAGEVLKIQGDRNIVSDNSSTYGEFLVEGDNNAVVGNTLINNVVTDTGTGNTINNIEF